ncbi:hypothetical protein RSOLAG22IIIB_02690 [Rhizoctonia solani]|uniref:Uncharacterized protein n=1 Tax=Rhizoctonia solani TaxID=456999 RepID=A0A0K6GHU3_9AGAM|nr:unnamed protein product [Rhizoctonia solani]CUA78075.1 hypothetical protein RSOLAG22IIIB_02690 [Rhizoctonia solani]
MSLISVVAVSLPGIAVPIISNKTGINIGTIAVRHTPLVLIPVKIALRQLRSTHVRYVSLIFGIHPYSLKIFDEDRPKLVQLDCRARIDNSTGGPLAWQPVVTNIINDDHPYQVVLEQGIAGDNLRFPIQLWSRGAFLSDGSALNQSIYRLTKGQATYPWKGPFIALKFSGTRRQGYVDMSLNDLPALVSHFLQVKGA